MDPIQIDLPRKQVSPRKRVSIVTLGCSKNTVDSETLMGLLQKNNLELCAESEGADAVIINTCGFIDVAKQESVNAILHAAQLKRQGSIGELYVAGCLSERYRQDLEQEIPEVGKYFGVTDFKSILDTLNPGNNVMEGMRYVPEGTASAYIKISEGCDNPCSFCAIPLMRGGHVSRPVDDILIEASHLASQGVKELVLVAQDTTYYGLDLYGQRSLAKLLDKVADVRGIEWVRLMYAYPAKFPLDILPVIAGKPAICKYIDMPVQHVSDAVLKSMRRGISRRALTELIDKIRQAVPGIALRTTLIVGYPAEGDAEFEELLDAVRQIQFDRLGVFAYSQEDDTTAHELGDPVPADVKQERMNRIMELQREISAGKNQERVGKKELLLVERQEHGEYICRSERDAPEVDGEVYLQSATGLQPGQFVEATITDAIDYDVFAELTA